MANKGTVISGVMKNNPSFSLLTLLASEKDPHAANVSGLMAWTGTDIVFHIKNIRGSSPGPTGGKGLPPGLAFNMQVELSLLSQANSKPCDGDKEFCCGRGTEWCALPGPRARELPPRHGGRPWLHSLSKEMRLSCC
eukprot:SAG11_NODE_3084_length_2706_cov_4.251630_4_plen_137_part_00